MALTTGSATGDQGTTQNPQTLPAQTIGASSQTGAVQPGTSNNLLTSQNGLSLSSSSLTAVSLNPGAATASQTQTAPVTKTSSHHINPAFFAVSAILVLIAIGLFWGISRSAKSTTNY